jgi:hypothetical protein
LVGLAAVIADGGEVISDFRVLADQRELSGPVASVPTAWQALSEIAAGGPRVQARLSRAVSAARSTAMPHPSPQGHKTSPASEPDGAFRRGLPASHRQHEHGSLTVDHVGSV